MPVICTYNQLRKILDETNIDTLTNAIKDGFIAYSKGDTEVPIPAHLDFEKPPGDCHIKYGYLKNSAYFVIKIATGFYNNSKLGLPSGDGLMVVLCKNTGKTLALLLDKGYLTDFRTAIAGRIVAEKMAPKHINTIGVVGFGVQGKLQLALLPPSITCKQVMIWTRNAENLKADQEKLEQRGYQVSLTEEVNTLVQNCNFIITTTPSKTPLIDGSILVPGTHITAVGADGSGKRELNDAVFDRSTRWVLDSKKQCESLGEYAFVAHSGETQVTELGDILQNDTPTYRNNGDEITVADLTGVAVQDIQIASYIYDQIKD